MIEATISQMPNVVVPKILPQQVIQQYHEKGYCFPLRVDTEAAAAGWLQQLQSFEQQFGGQLPATHRRQSHLLFAFLDELVHHPTILDAVEDLLGPNILCWNTSFFIKEADSPDYVTFHQDAEYWGLSSPDVVTAWVAFTHANTKNGAMRFLPGSHMVRYSHQDTFDEHNLLSRGQEVMVDVNEADTVQSQLAPGEISLHHVQLVHGSSANNTLERRVGLAIRYIATHVSQQVGERDSATLVRGKDEHGHFNLLPRPAKDFDPELVALHEALLTEKASILFKGAEVLKDGEDPLSVIQSGRGK